jgi:hypothetical protein
MTAEQFAGLLIEAYAGLPLALEGLLRTPLTKRVGLCAFGAGYTFGSTIIEQI